MRKGETILDNFPYKTFRPHQKEILQELEENLESFNFFMLEAPTGQGKSVIAYTLADWVRSEYGELTNICVRDKFLQEQYLHDFPILEIIKGRNNFPCLENKEYIENSGFEKQPYACDCGRCIVEKDFRCPFKPKREEERDNHGVIFDWSSCVDFCLYWERKDKAIRNDITLHNYTYYLLESNYVHDFSKRYLGVFDEAHLIEKALMDFVGAKITNKMLMRVGLEGDDTKIPVYKDIEDWKMWLKSLQEKLKKSPFSEESLDDKLPTKYFKALITFRRLTKKIEEIVNFLSTDAENWVSVIEGESGYNSVTFKPVTISDYSQALFGYTKKRLLMSATILDHEKLKRFLGINEDVKFLQVKESTFPVENRPFIQAYIGKATRGTMHFYLPKLVKELDAKYIPDNLEKKGVIHTHTNRIARYVTDLSQYKEHMMSTTGNMRPREETIKKFFESSPPKIMVSPSLGLGVDLKDDRCRWQIIAKVPYPNLGDPQIRKRTELDPEWYNWTVVMTLVQIYGRGCRSETDYCETFILDEKFMDLFSENVNIFPEWFKEALTRRSEWERRKKNG